jgi:hypothetical protein
VAHDRQRRAGIVLRVVGLSLAVAALAWTFRDTDPSKVGSLIGSLGGAGLLILLPHAWSLWVEAAGWRLAFQGMGQKLPLWGLFRARLATEALAQTLPLGVVLCESLKPRLLRSNCGADLATSLAGMAARKWLLIASQAVYVGGFALLAFPVLARVSESVLGAAGLPYVLLGAAAFLLLLAFVLFSLLSHGRLASRSFELLLRAPFLRRRLLAQRAKVSQADGRLQRFFGSARAVALPLPALLCGWLIEAADSALILHLLGVHLTWTTIGAVEVSSSFVRNLACVVPAGIGVQDLSYLAFLRALAVPDALEVTAAFLLLKRAKECFWALVGYAVLAVDLRPAPALSTNQEPSLSC